MLALAPAASADRSASSNWSGYAVHNASFRLVSARWRQPAATCAGRKKTYSAMWVGIGGYALASPALEQVGTELDCTAAGHVRSSAWYELVPSGSHTINLRVSPGDVVDASVQVNGNAVVISLNNLTHHHSYRRTLHPSTVDITSAEWILEAPSECIFGTNACQTLPLTDFGKAIFKTARAAAVAGPLGTISSGRWSRTKISLVPSGQQFVTNQRGGTPFGTARPSALNGYGGSFSVTYRRVYVHSSSGFAPRLRYGPAYLRH